MEHRRLACGGSGRHEAVEGIDKKAQVPDAPQHEQIQPPTPPEGHRDAEGFGQAAEALAGAGAGTGGGLAEVQVQRLLMLLRLDTEEWD